MSDPSAVEIEINNGIVSAKIIKVFGHSCNYIEYSRKLAKDKFH
jgi:hypothetical protein